MNDLETRRYPIGRFAPPIAPLERARRTSCIESIAHTPAHIRAAVDGLSESQLGWRYREGGWTIRQVVHHVADSHIHAYIRFKFALTEEAPAVKAYPEARWAEMPDVAAVPVQASVELLDALHQRWVAILHAMSDADFLRTYLHPERGTVALYDALAMYAWHGPHHLAHVEQALASRGELEA